MITLLSQNWIVKLSLARTPALGSDKRRMHFVSPLSLLELHVIPRDFEKQPIKRLYSEDV